MRRMTIGSILVLLALTPLVAAGDSDRKPAAPESSHRAVAPIPASSDTSMVTGSGLNTKSWPIDRAVSGGVLRKLPGHRDWMFVHAVSDAQMQQIGRQQQAELLRDHGSEPRDVEIAIPDSFALRKLARFHIPANCAPPCTLQARVLYRELPRLRGDSLFFWGLGEHKAAAQPSNNTSPPAPHAATPRPAK